jgi:hypothetical protein
MICVAVIADPAPLQAQGCGGMDFWIIVCVSNGRTGRLAGSEVTGRVILAHLGNGASLAAVHDSKPGTQA